MNVWKMNLKDNREERSGLFITNKFDFCKNNAILGIGWCGIEENREGFSLSEQNAYNNAKKDILSFEEGDLVWVKNPETKQVFLCEITSKAIQTNDEYYNKNDISLYCKCFFRRIDENLLSSSTIAENELMSRTTISKASETTASKSCQMFKENFVEENANFFDKIVNKILKSKVFNNFVNKVWKGKLKIYLSLSAIALFLVLILVSEIQNKQEAKIKKLFADKVFASEIQVSEGEPKNYLYIFEFNDKGQYILNTAYLNESGTEIVNMDSDSPEFTHYYDVNISFFGKKTLKCADAVSEIILKDNKIISLEDFYFPITESTSQLLSNYQDKLKKEKIEEEKRREEERKKEREEKLIKSYFPNEIEFEERVLNCFPEIREWTLYEMTEGRTYHGGKNRTFVASDVGGGNSVLVKDGANYCAYFEDGEFRVQEKFISDAAYENLVQLVFGDISKDLIIPDLETLEKHIDFSKPTSEEYLADFYEVEFKGITYEYSINRTVYGQYAGEVIKIKKR